MGVREIPASFEHVCDGCKKTENLASSTRPKYWIDLHILRDAYDFQGAAVADGSVKRRLCEECGEVVSKAVNEAMQERRADKGETR